MKTKTRLMSVAIGFMLILALLITGVYALDKAEVNLGGNLTFSASGVYAKVSGAIEGSVEDPELDDILFSSASADEPASWQKDLAFKADGSEITYTITIENLATDRSIYVSTYDIEGVVYNVSKSLANGAFVIEGGESDTITITMRVTNANLSLENAKYDYKVELMDEAAVPETTPDEAYNGMYLSEGVVTGWDGETAEPVIPAYHKQDGQIYTITTMQYILDDDESFSKLTLPQTLTTIEDESILACWDLEEIVIPASVESLGTSNFQGCFKLAKIQVDENNKYYDSRNDCNAIIETEGNTLLVGCKNTVVPDGILEIGDSAFERCYELANITIPDSVQTIGDFAFSSCSGLTSVTIGNGVQSIGDWTFGYCDSLTDVYYNGTEEEWSQIEIGEGNEPLLNANFHFKNGVYSYEYLYNEKHLDFDFYPAGAGEASAQSETENTASVKGVWDDENGQFLVSGDVVVPEKVLKDGIIYTVTAVADNAFSIEGKPGAFKMVNIALPRTVTTIGYHAFMGLEDLTFDINFSNIRSIGDRAFCTCTSFSTTKLDLTNVVYLGERAFSDCMNVTEIILGNKLQEISDHVFEYVSITKIKIPSTVKVIGYDAFFNCSSLTTVVIDSETIASALRGTGSPICGAILGYATSIYVKTDIVDSLHSYVKTNYTNVTTITEGDYAGYTCYAKA